MANTDVRDVAASDNPVLKVKGDSKPNSVAGAICNVVRESSHGEPPAVVATGPAAINQAMKAIAIARKYLLEEDSGAIDIVIQPRFEEDIRQSSRVCFVLKRSRPLPREVCPCIDAAHAHALALPTIEICSRSSEVIFAPPTSIPYPLTFPWPLPSPTAERG